MGKAPLLLINMEVDIVSGHEANILSRMRDGLMLMPSELSGVELDAFKMLIRKRWVTQGLSDDGRYRISLLDTVDKSVVLWYNEEKRTGVFLHGEQLSTARYVRCDVGNSQAVHNRKQGNVGRERKGYPSISQWRVLDFENGSTMERPAAGIW